MTYKVAANVLLYERPVSKISSIVTVCGTDPEAELWTTISSICKKYTQLACEQTILVCYTVSQPCGNSGVKKNRSSIMSISQQRLLK